VCRKYQFFQTIRSIPDQIISWRPNQKDCLWIQETIWSVIQSFSTLRDLHIDIQFLQLSPTFKALTTLETISIDASACSKTSWLYTSLSKLYASCPTLTSLAISDGSGHHSLTKENSLDQIFLECSKDVLPGRLCRLCLRGCFVRIDNITLPHLRQLTSLELICTQRRYSAGELDYYGGPRDIWSTFIGSGIQLEELVHNTTTTPLFDYLSSYSGLKKLELSVSPFADASSSDEAATRFFDDVLSRHLETLESLSLEACYEGEWCFTPRNAGLISHCTKLNHLLMGIISDKTPRAFNASPVVSIFVKLRLSHINFYSSTPRLQKHLLDIVIQLPLMRHLSLVPATPEYERDCYRCGNGIMNHFRLTKDQIMRDVTIYQPPHSCSYLLEVEVSGNAFKSVRDAARGHRRHVRFVSDLKNPRIRQ